MASIREHTSVGGKTTFKVLFRLGSRQSSRSFANRKAAERFVARIDLDGIATALDWLEQQATVRPAGMTLDQLAEQWLEARAADVATGDLTPRVLTGYRRDYANWISTWLGHLPADSITALDVQRWIDKIRAMPRSSPKSVADRHAILFGIFRWASDPRRGLLPAGHNPCEGTELPARKKPLPKGLRLPEIQALTASARRMNPPAADLIDFILGTGWRLGEAIALTAGQVEDDGTTVHVTMSRVWRREVGFVEDAKSEAGMRRIRVIGDAVGVLRRRMVGLSPADLVLTTERGLPWDETTFRRDHWRPIVLDAGLGGGWTCSCGARPTAQKRIDSHLRANPDHRVQKIEGRNPTPHWLRHSHVFVCHAAGMDLAQIQRRLGHSDIKMTINTYGRLIDGMTDEVADRLDALLTTRPASTEVVAGDVVQTQSISSSRRDR